MSDHLSNHAKIRATERSIRSRDLNLLLEEGDLLLPARDGAQALQLSRFAVQDAASRGATPEALRRVASLTAIIADGRVLTVYRRKSIRRLARKSLRR